jgi:hypothetical protein
MKKFQYMRGSIPVLVILCAGILARGQSLHQKSTQNDNLGDAPLSQQENPIPQISLTFSEAMPIPGVQGSPVVVMPMQCAPDGVPFMETLLPPSFREMHVSSLEKKGGHSFSLEHIPDLYDVMLLSYFPSSAEVAFLIYGTREPKQSEYTMQTQTGSSISGKAHRGDHHDFIALFDRNGRYKSLIDLPPELEYRKIAEFDSGDFLLLAYNPVNRVASLQVLNSSGEPVRTVALPLGMANSPALMQGETGGAVRGMHASASLSLWQFVSARGKLILYEPHAQVPVLELGPEGEVREVPLATPPGYELDAFIPSDDKWIVRFRRSGLSDEQVNDASTRSGNFRLDEINPLDGSILANLTMESGSVLNIACESNGNIISITLGKKSEFMRASASIPK